jgi:two-component sensor histidine kinase
VATLIELARLHTSLDTGGIDHLQRLVASWGMLADMCFADLLLLAPVAAAPAEEGRFIILGQVRPAASQTLHPDDLVGRIIPEAERALVARALRLGEIVEGEITEPIRGERARIQGIPIRYGGEPIAVLTRESAPAVGRQPGLLERSYVATFGRFARMILHGDYPFAEEETADSETPRVGDGVLLLDDGSRIEFASPNAVSALHRMGITSSVEGMQLEELAIDTSAVPAAFASMLPVTEEIERRPDVIVVVRCIPLIADGKVTGGVVLMRDVTDLRRRDRLLLSKDATIREVHHRVKNNLQMTSSLLRLQSRRLRSTEGRLALEEAVRRIDSIARVHEILSREAIEQVPFNEIVDDLIRVASDTARTLSRPVEFQVNGDARELPAQLATPLALVIQELLANAVEHAFPDRVEGDGEAAVLPGHVAIDLDNDGEILRVCIRDDGAGLPADFSLETSASLGLSITRTLVTTQLNGTMVMSGDTGTEVEIEIPVIDESGNP